MIRAMLFDLDGTLVKTERLKAISYARAAVELCENDLAEGEVIEAFKEVVGLSRQEVAQYLVDRFRLESAAKAIMEDFGVGEPWQAYVQVRLRHYEKMLADPEVIRKNTWPHNMALLHEAQRTSCLVGLATMSYCTQVRRVLDILGLNDAFDFVASRDDVENGKPDPEIYLLVARCLKTDPQHCLVIEDSPAGVLAALNAGMKCIAVTTPFTRRAIHEQRTLPEQWIVDDSDKLAKTVRTMIDAERRSDGVPDTKVDDLKRQAAEAAVQLLEPGMVVGLGHGSTTAHAVRATAERYARGELEGIAVTPCSEETAIQARDLGLPVFDLNEHPEVDITIDGADEIDTDMNLIKGGGGALLREKIVAQASKREVIIADVSKLSSALGGRRAVPVEVVPFGLLVEKRRIERLGAQVELRLRPDGDPFVTEHGNHILDCNFGSIEDLKTLAQRLSEGAGVVEHGLFVDVATDIFVASKDGIQHITKSRKTTT